LPDQPAATAHPTPRPEGAGSRKRNESGPARNREGNRRVPSGRGYLRGLRHGSMGSAIQGEARTVGEGGRPRASREGGCVPTRYVIGYVKGFSRQTISTLDGSNLQPFQVMVPGLLL
jgi:hypothetical protein